MTAEDYIKQALIDGRLTYHHIALLTKDFQAEHDVLVVDRTRCPDCGQQLRTERGADALALFWMHGFGAVARTTHVTCPCGYRRHWRTETISPLKN